MYFREGSVVTPFILGKLYIRPRRCHISQQNSVHVLLNTERHWFWTNLSPTKEPRLANSCTRHWKNGKTQLCGHCINIITFQMCYYGHTECTMYRFCPYKVPCEAGTLSVIFVLGKFYRSEQNFILMCYNEIWMLVDCTALYSAWYTFRKAIDRRENV